MEKENLLWEGPLETNHIRFFLFPILPEDRKILLPKQFFFWGGE